MGINYEDLKREVWDKGICSGCGACVAVCPANAIIFKKGDGSEAPVNTGYCKDLTDHVKCGACYAVCPHTGDAASDKKMLGEYISIGSARSAFEVPGRQSGGAVTALLSNAFESGLIDGVITVSEDRWTHEPFSVLITSDEAITASAGSRYNWWVPTLASLKEAVIKKKLSRIAVVGTPCAVQALIKMKESDNDLVKPFGNSIRLIIGLFCTETFDYGKLIEGKLKSELDIEPWNIKSFDVKGRLEIRMNDGSVQVISLKELEECIRPGCFHCTDFTAVDSDISAGSVGSEEGLTTLIIRNKEGMGFVDSAVRNEKLIFSDEYESTPIEKLAEKKSKRK
ncbi:Coenzyme F420 hydrogenase/dehydrogenase, beta subunit C-terminal domain [Methanolacinia petrolearia]|uniref:Coenzyme F420 hydrogenase/dehydrogenase, beta subunit C-terminal domain n=1 Tax=Methanolacinia petrolearia TaxID=54120 RepID=UPI003BAB6579